MTDAQDYLYECANCENRVPFEGMRCMDCFVGTTTEYLYDYVPEFAVGGDPDAPDLPNLRAAAVSGSHVTIGIYDRKGGEQSDEPAEWVDQMLHVDQAENLIVLLNEAIENTEDIPDQ